MSLNDHLVVFETEDAARTALPQYWMPESDDGPGSWRGDICFVGYRNEDGTSTGTRIYRIVNGEREYSPGWAIQISLPTLDETLRDLPDNACRIIADYDAYLRGEADFIRYLAPDLDPATLNEWHLEPQPAREKAYPFGNAPAVP